MCATPTDLPSVRPIIPVVVNDFGVEKSPAKLIDSLECLEWKLPPCDATAGVALRHARTVIDGILRRHSPAIFKIGFTHNALWRWSNKLYGYQFDRVHKWEKMVVFYESTESSGAAMLEACLIDGYKSILSAAHALLSSRKTFGEN